MDHPGKTHKGVFIRLIFAEIKRAGNMRGGIGISHRQVDHVQAQFIVQLPHEADRLRQVRCFTAFRTDTKAPR